MIDMMRIQELMMRGQARDLASETPDGLAEVGVEIVRRTEG